MDQWVVRNLASGPAVSELDTPDMRYLLRIALVMASPRY